MEVERANVGEKIFSKNFTQMGDKSAVDVGAFSTTEHTEAAFAGTESGWGKGTETTVQSLSYPSDTNFNLFKWHALDRIVPIQQERIPPTLLGHAGTEYH